MGGGSDSWESTGDLITLNTRDLLPMLIVDVGVTDKNVLFEIHKVILLFGI